MIEALIAVVVSVMTIVALVNAIGAFIEGILDGEHPALAHGDYRNGIWRSIYTLGVAKGARIKATREERRRLNEERRGL